LKPSIAIYPFGLKKNKIIIIIIIIIIEIIKENEKKS